MTPRRTFYPIHTTLSMTTRSASSAKTPSYTFEDLQAFAARFESRTKVKGTCLVWQWTHKTRRKREPQLNFVLLDGRQAGIGAARMAYALQQGKLLTSDDVLRRTCQTKDCVNPAHHTIESRQALEAARLPLMRQKSMEKAAKKKKEQEQRAAYEQNRRAALYAPVAQTIQNLPVRPTAASPVLAAAYGTQPRATLKQLSQLLDLVRETAALRRLDFDLSLGYLVDLYQERPGTLAIVRINPARGFVRGNVEFATDLVQLAS